MLESLGNESTPPADREIGTGAGVQAKRRAMEHELQKALDAYSVLLNGGQEAAGAADAEAECPVSRKSAAEGHSRGSAMENGRATFSGRIAALVSGSMPPEPGQIASDIHIQTALGVCREPVRGGAVGNVCHCEDQGGAAPGAWQMRGKREFSVAIHVADGVASVLLAAPREQEALARETLLQHLQKENWRIGRIRLNGAVVLTGAEDKIKKTGGYY